MGTFGIDVDQGDILLEGERPHVLGVDEVTGIDAGDVDEVQLLFVADQDVFCRNPFQEFE